MWIEASEHVALEQYFLRHLAYERMEERHTKIAEAHTQTFQWIFKPLPSNSIEQPQENGNFASWLKNDNGIFWVSGKPGSGKSTLMKFISGHKKTRSSLKQWAGDNMLVASAFFF